MDRDYLTTSEHEAIVQHARVIRPVDKQSALDTACVAIPEWDDLSDSAKEQAARVALESWAKSK